MAGEVETVAVPAKTFTIETTETLHRKYVVQAPDRDTAVRRLRIHWSDPDALAHGVVMHMTAKDEVTSKQVRK